MSDPSSFSHDKYGSYSILESAPFVSKDSHRKTLENAKAEVETVDKNLRHRMELDGYSSKRSDHVVFWVLSHFWDALKSVEWLRESFLQETGTALTERKFRQIIITVLAIGRYGESAESYFANDTGMVYRSPHLASKEEYNSFFQLIDKPENSRKLYSSSAVVTRTQEAFSAVSSLLLRKASGLRINLDDVMIQARSGKMAVAGYIIMRSKEKAKNLGITMHLLSSNVVRIPMLLTVPHHGEDMTTTFLAALVKWLTASGVKAETILICHDRGYADGLFRAFCKLGFTVVATVKTAHARNGNNVFTKKPLASCGASMSKYLTAVPEVGGPLYLWAAHEVDDLTTYFLAARPRSGKVFFLRTNEATFVNAFDLTHERLSNSSSALRRMNHVECQQDWAASAEADDERGEGSDEEDEEEDEEEDVEEEEELSDASKDSIDEESETSDVMNEDEDEDEEEVEAGGDQEDDDEDDEDEEGDDQEEFEEEHDEERDSSEEEESEGEEEEEEDEVPYEDCCLLLGKPESVPSPETARAMMAALDANNDFPLTKCIALVQRSELWHRLRGCHLTSLGAAAAIDKLCGSRMAEELLGKGESDAWPGSDVKGVLLNSLEEGTARGEIEDLTESELVEELLLVREGLERLFRGRGLTRALHAIAGNSINVASEQQLKAALKVLEKAVGSEGRKIVDDQLSKKKRRTANARVTLLREEYARRVLDRPLLARLRSGGGAWCDAGFKGNSNTRAGADMEDLLRPLLPSLLMEMGAKYLSKHRNVFREVGPVCQDGLRASSHHALATSVDGLFVASPNTGPPVAFLWENKARTSPKTIRRARALARSLGVIRVVTANLTGGEEDPHLADLTAAFPRGTHRQELRQVLHHIAVTGLDCVYTEADTVASALIRVVVIKAAEGTRAAYRRAMQLLVAVNLPFLIDEEAEVGEGREHEGLRTKVALGRAILKAGELENPVSSALPKGILPSICNVSNQNKQNGDKQSQLVFSLHPDVRTGSHARVALEMWLVGLTLAIRLVQVLRLCEKERAKGTLSKCTSAAHVSQALVDTGTFASIIDGVVTEYCDRSAENRATVADSSVLAELQRGGPVTPRVTNAVRDGFLTLEEAGGTSKLTTVQGDALLNAARMDRRFPHTGIKMSTRKKCWMCCGRCTNESLAHSVDLGHASREALQSSFKCVTCRAVLCMTAKNVNGREMKSCFELFHELEAQFLVDVHSWRKEHGGEFPPQSTRRSSSSSSSTTVSYGPSTPIATGGAYTKSTPASGAKRHRRLSSGKGKGSREDEEE